MPTTRLSFFTSLIWSTSLAALAFGIGCVGEQPHALLRTFDACAPLRVGTDPATTPERADAIGRGLAMWNDLAGTHVSAVPVAPPSDAAATGDEVAAPTVPMRFQNAAPPFHGLYDDSDAIIFINEDLDGDPPALSITVAHEVGHAFGLLHVSPDIRPSLMNPGNLTVTPTAADVDALAALWGVCAR